METITNELDKVLHQPIRTHIMAYLVTHGSCDFNTIKKLFALSDGHMTTHMRELLEHDYVATEKLATDGKSKTIYHITPTGKNAFENYVNALKKIITFE